MEALAFLIIVIFAIWLQKYIFTRFIFTNLNYSCSFSVTEAFEGDEIHMTEIVHNNKLLPLHWLKVELCSSKWLSFGNTRSAIAQESRFVTSGYHLGSYQKTTRVWKVKCLKRGVYTTENATLVGGDHFGTLSRSMPVHIDMQLTVFPGTVDLQDILISSKGMQGDILTRRWILDDPFIVSGAREYLPGDPLNRMHWQATAGQGMLMVRKNDFTVQQEVLVILNIQSMGGEHGATVNKEIIELEIKIAAAVFNKAVSFGIPAGFATNGCIQGWRDRMVLTGIEAGERHLFELLTVLSQLELRNTIEFDDCLEELVDTVNSCDVIIITAYLNERLCKRIDRIRQRSGTVKVVLPDGECGKESFLKDVEVYRFNSNIL